MYSCFKAKVIGFTFMHALTNCNTFYQNIQANILSLLNISLFYFLAIAVKIDRSP